MARKLLKHLPIVAGDVFAIPLEDGRFSVCRVLRIRDKTGLMFVASSAWIGSKVPEMTDSALRPLLRLTHHSWKNKICAVWVSGTPPRDFIRLGNIAPIPAESAVKVSALGSWPFFKIQASEQW